MKKFEKQSSFLVNFLLICVLINLIECQTNGYDPNSLGGLVDVDVHNTRNGGKHVGVHVPIFYSMDLDKEPHRTGLGINVLDGLIKVRVKKDPKTRKQKGLLVALADIPIWDAK